METSNQVVEGTVADAGGALKRLMVSAKVLRAKKTFLTTLEAFRGTSQIAMVCAKITHVAPPFGINSNTKNANASGLAQT